jgi:DNA invertase Pin-like site-specific DNA recombinase
MDNTPRIKPQGTPRVVAYLRTAIKDEARIAVQLADIRQHLETRGWTLSHVYTDNGHSGLSGQRPAFLQLQQDIQAGKVDVVATCNAARLTRDSGLMMQFIQLLQQHHIALISIQDAIGPVDPGKLVAIPS